MMLSLEQPFMIFDDARQSGAAMGRYYHDLHHEVPLKCADDVYALGDVLRQALRDGYYVAGYLSYEAGLLLEKRTAPLWRDLREKIAESHSHDAPLGWFGCFTAYDDMSDISALLPAMGDAQWSILQPEISQKQYDIMFENIQNYINDGDIYQANLTFRCHGQYSGDRLALYRALRSKAAAGYGGILHVPQADEETILSFSPELFFTLQDNIITARPMKGTASVMADKAQDDEAINRLRHDPKQRAENLMIVDLLRNDLSKICEPYSVKVPQLFHIESYPTVHQMTSTVIGKLYEKYDAVDVLLKIFPCGSITGAPKIRAMEILNIIEKSPRGSYCGSMGWIDPNGDAAFNVAIRSLSMQHDSDQFSIGLGSGIVSDSVARDEWAECLAKGAFINMGELQQGHDN